METGTIRWFDHRKNNFGFAVPDHAGEEIFIHGNIVPAAILPDLREGVRIRYRVELDRKGRPRASYVELAEPFATV
jgi:cold shock CspA family protein